MLRYCVIWLVMTLTGCANGIPNINTEIDHGIEVSNEKIFVGIPLFASLEGTTARLDSEWIVTAAHNKLILSMTKDEVYYHPTCDIALIRSQGTSYTEVGKVYEGQLVTHVGYPIGLPLSTGKGSYVGEIVAINRGPCQMSATTGVLMSGMSGGGTYNHRNELVGVNHGYAWGDVQFPNVTVSQPAIFVSLYRVRDWLTEITGNDYFLE